MRRARTRRASAVAHAAAASLDPDVSSDSDHRPATPPDTSGGPSADASDGTGDGPLAALADVTLPPWAVELLDVLELRRTVVITSAVGLAFLGVLAALVAPSLVPPRPLVGVAVGLAAILLAVAITLGVDSVDLVVRGPRHVRSSGGHLAAHLRGQPGPAPLGPLADAVAERAGADGRHLIGMVPAVTTAPVEAWHEALARALSLADLRVLTVDLVTRSETHPGVVDVAEGSVKIGAAVQFDDELLLARIGPGRDRAAALAAFPAVTRRLPADVDVLLAALPEVSEDGVLSAVAGLDHIYVVAESGRTPRVDLIATLDALDEAGVASEVLLVGADEPSIPATVAPPGFAPEPDAVAPGADDASVDEPADDDPPAAARAREPDPGPLAATGPLPPLDARDGGEDAADDEPAPPGPDVADMADDERWDDAGGWEDVAGESDDPIVGDALAVAVAEASLLDDLDGAWGPADGGIADDPVVGPGRWAPPPPTPAGSHMAAPAHAEDADLPEDPVRVAAALQTLAQEIWTREGGDS